LRSNWRTMEASIFQRVDFKNENLQVNSKKAVTSLIRGRKNQTCVSSKKRLIGLPSSMKTGYSMTGLRRHLRSSLDWSARNSMTGKKLGHLLSPCTIFMRGGEKKRNKPEMEWRGNRGLAPS